MQILINIIVVLVALSIYLLPAMIAVGRRHVNALPIFLTNLYLGWVFGLGWIAALIWGFSQTVTVPATAAAAAYTPDAARTKMAPATLAKYIAGAVGAILLIVVVALLLTPVSQDAVKNKMSGKQPPAPVTTGVPQPASSLIGE